MTEAKKAEVVIALRKCAKEHEKDVTYTGNVIVSNLCNDVADYVEELQSEVAKLNSKIEEMKCCGNCNNNEFSAHEEPCVKCKRCFASKDKTVDNWW